MALDTKQKRGSVLDLTQPWREWLAEPDGSLAVADRQALLKLGSGVATTGTTITGVIGVAVASGFTANINANRTILSVLGIAYASGFQATIVNSTGVVAIAQRGRTVLEAKALADVRRVTFDLISQLAAGESLVSAETDLAVYSGADPTNLLAWVGSPAVDGTRVTQLITGGVAGTSYKLICRGVANTGKQTFSNAFLAVL